MMRKGWRAGSMQAFVATSVTELGLPSRRAGLTFALAASPCSTPILATLLAYVSTTRDPVTGADPACSCCSVAAC